VTPDAVVFDNDGLLLDTEQAWTRAEVTLFERHGSVFTLEHKRDLLGSSRDVAAAKLERMLRAPGGGQALMDELHELVWEEVARGAPPMPGAVELLTALRGRGTPVGLASNSTRDFVERTLGLAGLLDAFDVVVAADEVGHPKPAPDIYLEAAVRLGADASRCTALEDSQTGVAAARAAGMVVIGVPSLEGVELDADVVAASLAEPAVHAALGL
jgi:HAD superfamily hydrolase (TIGR01509 family)